MSSVIAWEWLRERKQSESLVSNALSRKRWLPTRLQDGEMPIFRCTDYQLDRYADYLGHYMTASTQTLVPPWPKLGPADHIVIGRFQDLANEIPLYPFFDF